MKQIVCGETQNIEEKKLGYISNDIDIIEAQNIYMESLTGKQITIYPEHNDEYLQECLDNLRSKGIEISL